jgi:DNA-binding response OmpR family regulator
LLSQGLQNEGAISMLKVLIAEDELMIADEIEEALIASGYEVCGIARTVDEAVALGDLHDPDLAVLDVRLVGGGRGTEIVRRLNKREKIGVLYATAYSSLNRMLTLNDGEGSIEKPFCSEDLVRALAIVQEIKAFGGSTSQHPPGFRVLSLWPQSRAQFVQGSLA